MSIESVMPSNHLILWHPLLFLPSTFPSIWVFSNESVLCTRCPKYWNFSFSISPSNEYSGLISFRKDWLDLLAVQGTIKSLLQHHSSQLLLLEHNLILYLLAQSGLILTAFVPKNDPQKPPSCKSLIQRVFSIEFAQLYSIKSGSWSRFHNGFLKHHLLIGDNKDPSLIVLNGVMIALGWVLIKIHWGSSLEHFGFLSLVV